MLRTLTALLVALGGFTALAACDSFASESADIDPSGPGGDGDDGAPECAVANDCSLVASSCCECPTFAVPAGTQSCEDVECPAEPECAPAEAICETSSTNGTSGGRCVLACSPQVTTQQCESGFVVDEAGCTLDQCAAGIASECSSDVDCVIAAADCCGCEQGGNDTAVSMENEAGHLDSLMCTGNESCPGVSSCDVGARADCLGGTCRYVTGGGTDTPLALCGTLDTEPCLAGEVCVLNASIPGIGVCQPE